MKSSSISNLSEGSPLLSKGPQLTSNPTKSSPSPSLLASQQSQAGMLVLQFKQLSDIDKSFAKSIINGFQYTTEEKEHIFVVSQSATILSVPCGAHSHTQAEGSPTTPLGNEEVIVSSANYLFKYLSQQVGMSYQEIRQKRVELGQIMERCRFFLVRKSKHQEG